MRLIWLVVLGCSGGTKGASGTLDPAQGGTVGLSDGTAAVVIGPNALGAPTQVTVSADPAVPPASLGVAVSGCFRFGPEGLQFQSPVTVTLAIDGTRLPAGSAEDQVFIATAEAGSSSFTGLTTTVADATHVAAQTSHFSVFCAVSPPVTDASVPADLATPVDLAQPVGDGPTPLPDLLMPSPSCSPYPSPSAACSAAPAPSTPPAGCGWEMMCGSASVPYSVLCYGNICYCYSGGTQTQTFLQGSLCSTVDGGTSSTIWSTCCFPK